jgi:translation initiation factor eIF-2B subunit delta
MEQLLKRQLRAIAGDKHSGANELARRTVAALQSWIRRSRKADERGLVEAFHLLVQTQPGMAPFLRLANEVALAADSSDPAKALLRSCRSMENILKRGPGIIAQRFRRALGAGPRKTILTYSYSSTVLRALIHSKSRIRQIYCSEASPEMEGRALARKLAGAGIRVTLTTDLALPSFIHDVDTAHPRPDAVVVGADQVTPANFVNRYGTELLSKEAQRAGVPVWVLTDTTKFIRESRRDAGHARIEIASRLWKDAPKGVTPWLRLLGEVPFAPHIRVLTEGGWMTRDQVRQSIQQITLSPRVKAILGLHD